AAEHAHRLLELLDGSDRSVDHDPVVPDGEPARPRALPELLGRQAPRQQGPPQSYGVLEDGRVSEGLPGSRAADHADHPVPDRERDAAAGRVGRTDHRPRGLLQRLEATRAEAPRGLLPQRAPRLRRCVVALAVASVAAGCGETSTTPPAQPRTIALGWHE